MTRLTKAGLALFIAGLVCVLRGSSPLVTTAIAQGQNKAQQQARESTRDAPTDTTPYTQPELRVDYAQKGIRPVRLTLDAFIVDVVVNNTSPNLKYTDPIRDRQQSI